MEKERDNDVMRPPSRFLRMTKQPLEGGTKRAASWDVVVAVWSEGGC